MISSIEPGMTYISGHAADIFLELAGIIEAYKDSMAERFGEERALRLVVLVGRMAMAEKNDDEAEGKRITDEVAQILAEAVKEKMKDGIIKG